MQLGKRSLSSEDQIIEKVFFFNSSTVVLYDIQSQKQDFIINTARKAITSLALSPDGRYLATGEVKMNHYFFFFQSLLLVWS